LTWFLSLVDWRGVEEWCLLSLAHILGFIRFGFRYRSGNMYKIGSLLIEVETSYKCLFHFYNLAETGLPIQCSMVYHFWVRTTDINARVGFRWRTKKGSHFSHLLQVGFCSTY